MEPEDFARGAIRNLKFEGICVSSPSSGIHTYFTFFFCFWWEIIFFVYFQLLRGGLRARQPPAAVRHGLAQGHQGKNGVENFFKNIQLPVQLSNLYKFEK